MSTETVGDVPATSFRRRAAVRAAFRSPTFVIGVVVVLFWAICALFGDSFVPFDPNKGDILKKLQSPSAHHWFGTDALGRDVFSRVLVGSRDILLISVVATLLGTIGGTILGLLMGYLRGWVDLVLSRVLEAVLALPFILVALIAVAARGASKPTVIFAIAFAFTPIIARTIRSAVMVQREQDYVQAARLRNEKSPYIMFSEILPNVTGPIIVEGTVRLGYAAFAVAVLSFIGAGVQPPSADWGLTVSERYGQLSIAWWQVLFPCIAIATLVIAVNLIADGLAEAQK
jgi:peptide/nickel transport system permease protein